MKIKNKYNIGDYVWIGKNTPTRHKIKAIEAFIHPERGTCVSYVLEGIPPEYCGFNESECFLSKEECVRQKSYNIAKATGFRINNDTLRLVLIAITMVVVIPFSVAQSIYWIFTGRHEPLTYRIMNRINMMLDNGKA